MPGDDYSASTLLGLPVLQLEGDIFRRLRGFFKKLWVLFGPYDRFLYLDADQIALKPLAPLIERICSAPRPFFIASLNQAIRRQMFEEGDEVRRALYEQRCGRVDLLEELDPGFDWCRTYPFSSGDFATHRDFIQLPALQSVFEAAQVLHRERNLPPLGCSREGLFGADQGLFNYLVYRSGVPPDLMPDLYLWGGMDRSTFEELRARDRDDPLRHLFVHWGGCPRPTLLRRSVPAAVEWIRFYCQFYRDHGSPLDLVAGLTTHLIADLHRQLRDAAHQL